MKNSKLRRVLMLLACAVLLVCLSVGATLAYLTSTTDVVENTFTVGKVQLTLDEAWVDEFGNWLTEGPAPDGGTQIEQVEERDWALRVQDNHYKLYPGKTYPKDPTIHVKALSESCYVFIKINKNTLTYTKTETAEDGTITQRPVNIEENHLEDGYTSIAVYMSEHGWRPLDAAKYPGVYYYHTIVNTSGNADRDLVIFEEFKIDELAEMPNPDDANFASQIAELKIQILGFAIQAEGFCSSELANAYSDNDISVVPADAIKAWDAAAFNTSFDQ